MTFYKNTILAVVGATLLGIPSSARADDTYNFNVKTYSDGNISAYGSFTTSSSGIITSVSGTAVAGQYSYSIGYSPATNTFLPSTVGQSSIFAVFATSGLANMTSTGGNIQIYSFGLNEAQNSTIKGNVYLGAYHQTNGIEDLKPGSGGNGFFEAVLASLSNGGGGSPSSGGSSSSGGAPSPEVNSLFGLALAAGTVAFLRRRKRQRCSLIRN